MAGGLADDVKKAASAGNVVVLKQLVAAHGGSAVRLDGNPDDLTALHWAAASGVVEAVNYLLASPVLADARVLGRTTSPRCMRLRCRATRRCARCC